jgi:peptidoglycan/LPS O-acetylase OafA/YrhL
LYFILVLLLENNAAGRLFIHNLPYYLSYTSNWFVDLKINDDGQRRVIFIFAWSLATEEQFYLLWPSAMKFFKRSTAIAVLISVVSIDLALTFAFGTAEIPNSTAERVLRIVTSPSTEICAGVLLALVLHSKAGFTLLWQIFGRRWSAPVFAALLLVVMLRPGEATTAWHVAFAAAGSMFLAACVIREDHGLARLLQIRFLTRVGVVSYGMYMLHMLAVNSVKTMLHRFDIDNQPLTFALAVLIAYAAAEFSFRFFESPILKLKARFRQVIVPVAATRSIAST